MRRQKMPTTRVLLFASWLIALFCLSKGGYLILFKFKEVHLLIQGFLTVVGGIILAGAIRMLANIGQMLFDLNNLLANLKDGFTSDFQNLRSQLQNIGHDLNSNFQNLRSQLQNIDQDLNSNFQYLKNNSDQLNCDSKDMNQNIYQIRNFFEQIAKHLDFKK